MPPIRHYAHTTHTMDDPRTQSESDAIIHQKLLPELMSHIFELCIYSQWETQWEKLVFERREYPKGYFKPLSLGAVSRDWREIACSTHGLWSRVFILVNTSPDIEHEHVHTWLTRSGNHPLTLYMAWQNDWDVTPAIKSHETLIETINRYSSRWSQLFINGSIELISRICGRICNGQPTPFLKTLKLKPSIDLCDFSSIFPSKTVLPPSFSLFLKNQRDCSLKDLCVDWSDVTHLELTHVRAAECMDVLGKAPRLTFLSIEDFNSKYENQIIATPLKHESLQSFKLCSRNSEFNPYLQILPKVSFSALNEMHCEFIPSHADSMRSLEPLASFIERSGCSLKKLSLVDISSSDQELIRLLKTTPSLEELFIAQPSWLKAEDGKMLGPLWDYIGTTTTTTTTTFLPNLRSLRYMSRLPDIPWNLFPGVFGDIGRILAKYPRRPLNKLTIISSTPPPGSYLGYVDSDEEDEPNVEEAPDNDLIDQDTVVRFIQLKRAGMTIDIYNAFDPTQDLIKRSMDIHEILV